MEHTQVEYAQVVIIGGGPAGLSAAISAYDCSVGRVVILERDHELGGILNQCIHNGFGLHTFKEELTGPEYANRFIQQVNERNIEVRCDTMVLEIRPDKTIVAVNPKDGCFVIQADAVILAMGCLERSRGALNIPGDRPAGIYCAGTAQRLVNIENYMPGKEVVILGSGDIGLIMARRMTLEGAKVKLVAELMPYSGGLKRNIVQCLEDYGIPLKLNHTVTKIHGKKRLTGVTICKVDESLQPIAGCEEYYPCDTLLLSVGLVPENELSRGAGIELDPVTKGPIVNESLETSVEGIYACGNVLHVHDLVDYVTMEAKQAGIRAAEYVKKESIHKSKDDPQIKDEFYPRIPIQRGKGIRYTVPQYIRIDQVQSELLIRFRVDGVYSNCCLTVTSGTDQILRQKKKIVTPGEMQEIRLTKEQLKLDRSRADLQIQIEEA